MFSLRRMAQTDPVIMNHGYSYPAPIRVAPGQLVTLYFAGIPLEAEFRARDGEDPRLSITVVSPCE